MNAGGIPQSPEAISPELVGRALSARYPGAEAASVEVIDAHSGTTGRARLRVRWKHAAGAPETIFAKLAPTDGIQREMVIATDMGRREARFYAGPARDMPVRVAAPYHAVWSDDGTAYLMLIEDLAASGCRFPSWKDERLQAHAGATMDTLARLHAGFHESPRFAGDLSWIEPPMRHAVGPLLVRSAVEQFGAEMPASFHALATIYLDHTDALSDSLDSGPQTLIHGDSHLGNLFLDGAEIGMLDWACTARAPGLRDVSYFLCNSIPSEMRRAEEKALLRRYLAGLAAAGAPAADFDDAFHQYRRLAVCSWVAATVTAAAGSRMQALEIGMRSMQRSTEAIDDLETPALLREELGLS